MYTSLLKDQPENRSRGKAAFTFPLILLFILVGVASTRHLMNANANNSLESMLAEPVAEEDVAPMAPGGGVAPVAPAAPGVVAPVAPADEEAPPSICTTADGAWWCIDKCAVAPDCDVILALDLGSSGTKPALWAIKKGEGEEGKKDRKKIPDMKLIGTNEKSEAGEMPGWCGFWADDKQFFGKKETYCDGQNGMPDAKSTAIPKKCAGLFGWDNFGSYTQHFKDQMKCFLNKELTSGSPPVSKPIKDYISGTYGGVTAGLRNDPDIKKKFAVLHEETGEIWSQIKEVTGKPVHLRMISGEEEAYYEWLSYNWDTLRKYENNKGRMQEVQDELKNIMTIGGASAQIAIPTAHPMNTLDHTYYFHIGVDKYWVYANSIMWAGSTRFNTLIEEYKKDFGGSPSVKEVNDDFFKKNNEVLCSDIVKFGDKLKVDQLYSGLCVMGFHFPSANQWLTNQFVGNQDWGQLGGKKDQGFCMEKGSGESVKMNFNDACDSIDKAKLKANSREGKLGSWWNKDRPQTTLPLWGRFWNKLTNAAESDFPGGMIEYSKAKQKSWGAVWAAMWLHGKFQGFPNLDNPNNIRRNLGGLKGEYTLGPLRIPAHFGTPEDSN